MRLFTIFNYVYYNLFSGHRHGHGIHSPFVFDLVSKVLRNKFAPDIVFSIETIRKKMVSNPDSIVVHDLGSGSRKMKSSLRKVSDIAKTSAISRKYGIFLSRMSGNFSGRLVIELGTSLGISTLYLASSCPGTPVFTIEGCSSTAGIAARNFSESGLTNIRQFTGPFEKVLDDIISMDITPGLVFIDGDHRKGPLKKYFSKVAAVSDSNTVIIIDDIYSSREMAQGWDEIKNDDRVTLTVDIFRMGVVFFRKGITPGHYVIRY
jgi:predicted O-methyltransferase YrrM